MSLGWHLSEPLVLVLVPRVLICLLALGSIPEGEQCNQQVEADQVETEEETVVEAPLVEEEVRGEEEEDEDTGEVAARAQRLVLRLAVLGPESFVCGHYAGVLGLNLVPSLTCCLQTGQGCFSLAVP